MTTTIGKQFYLDGYVNDKEPTIAETKKNRKKSERDSERDFVNHFLYVFKAPIVTWPGYEDTLTEEMKNKVNIYRLAGIKNISEKMATDYEATLYLSTASLVAPMSHTWYKLYMHTFSRYYDIGKVLGDEPTEKVYENELQGLKRLKSWIYKKQIEHLKPHLIKRNEKQKPKNEKLF